MKCCLDDDGNDDDDDDNFEFNSVQAHLGACFKKPTYHDVVANKLFKHTNNKDTVKYIKMNGWHGLPKRCRLNVVNTRG